MKFTKMHGIGNDYVYVNAIEETVENPSELAIRVSDRHFGIGSDGLILIRASEKADFMMDMYNLDGSRGKMCGNGIRCVGKYVYDHGLTDKKIITIETLSGIKTLNLFTKRVEDVEGYQGVSNNGKVVYAVTVNMGSPIFEPDQVPVKLAEGYSPSRLGNLIDVNPVKHPALNPDQKVVTNMGMSFEMRGTGSRPQDKSLFYYGTCLSMGNPHCVIFINDAREDSLGRRVLDLDVNDDGSSVGIDVFDVKAAGSLVEKSKYFPEQVNTEFVEVVDRTHVNMRVWERGSGETMACGTGACATAVACMLNGKVDDEVTVTLLGGDLKIRWDREENSVFMTGPATTVFEGEI